MAAGLLLWILALCSSVAPSGSHTLNGVKIYEVVRPIRLHERHRRDVQSSRPVAVKYAMTLGGKDIEMHLERNDGLLTQDYTETHYADDGTPITTQPDQLDFCYYQGHIVNESDSMVSVSTCDGLRGYFQTAEQRFLIEPMSEDSDGDHAVVKYEDVSNTPTVCGVTNTSWDENTGDFPPRVSKSRARGAGPTMFQQQKYNELFIVADNRMYQKSDSNVDKVKKRIYEIINFVNAVYKPVNTFIALTGLEIWSDSDKIVVTAPAGETLDKFTTWRNDVLMKRQPNDNAHLITGIDFEGSTVGLAFIGTLCSGHSTGVIQDHSSNAIAVGATLSHEMGHNLGMNHDTSSCTCPDSSCIMAPALSYTIPKQFSSCSVSNLEQYLNSRNPNCLLNKPLQKSLLQPPVCGNGFLESGEQCDCGSVTECSNPCCNATTCRLTEGSQCADGACCRDCKIIDAYNMCRAKQDECDLPEYCTGDSNLCPEDVFAVNGLPCKSGSGYCFNGQCPKKEDQCIKMWGSGAVLGTEYCFNQNARGVYYAYCSRPTTDQYIGCQKQDVMCGKLFCEKGQDNPNYGRMVSFGTCRATFYSDRDNDFGQVDTGTKCSEDRVCSQNQCVTLEVAYRAINCSAKCRGHGVCNHKLECACEPGWLPPDCERQAGGGISRNGVIAIVVVVCIVLGTILLGVGIFLMKRRKRSPRQTSQQIQRKDPVPMDKSQFIPSRVAPPPPSPTPIRPKGPPPPPPPKANAPPKTLHTDFRAAQKALRPPPPPRV
ncbi:disintegrin and metalloproteinase domain-containing protein 28 [Astyanax mexicanus]|uniref:disintegrin and metalloproteinase domain-containing protein 28 n=1 Tax=Astyanax mexicanus TaxID=7994 RepID=UPI0020CB145E|nr:disintegrin and metalloproteinase domain-containing protein 28 [Astyanax mexicanus]